MSSTNFPFTLQFHFKKFFLKKQLYRQEKICA